jgi:hypothetical protein
MRHWGALLVALIGAGLLAIIGTTPPRAVPASAPATAFSAARAMADVRAIGHTPHPAGSAEHERVRDYLTGRLAGLGFTVSTTSSAISAAGAKAFRKQNGAAAPLSTITDIVAIRRGCDPALPAVMLMAHYDSVVGSPAAADDSAGVSSVLEAARAIAASGPARRDMIVLLTDGEELGLDGARAFFAGNPLREHVGVIVNLETRGGGGRASMFETGEGNGAMMRLFAGAVRRPVATSLSVFVYKHLPNDTDLTIAKAHGFPGFNFAFIGRPSQYHSPSAVPAALDQGALQDMGRQVLDLARGLLDAPALPGRAPDRVFFDAFGLVLIAYPAWAGWLLLGAAIGFYAVGAWRRVSPGTAAWGAATTLALLAGGGALLYGGNLLSGADGPVNYYDRLAAIPRLEWQILLICLGALALVWALLVGERDRIGIATGAAVPLLVLGTVAQAVAPTAAYPIVVPLLLGGAGLAAMRRPGGVGVAVVAAMLGIGYMLAMGFLLVEAVGPFIPVVAALPLAVASVLAMPLVPAVGRRQALIAAAVMLALAIGIALWVRLDALAASVATYSRFK